MCLICVYVDIGRIEQAYEHMRDMRDTRVYGVIDVKRNIGDSKSSKTREIRGNSSPYRNKENT